MGCFRARDRDAEGPQTRHSHRTPATCSWWDEGSHNLSFAHNVCSFCEETIVEFVWFSIHMIPPCPSVYLCVGNMKSVRSWEAWLLLLVPSSCSSVLRGQAGVTERFSSKCRGAVGQPGLSLQPCGLCWAPNATFVAGSLILCELLWILWKLLERWKNVLLLMCIKRFKIVFFTFQKWRLNDEIKH